MPTSNQLPIVQSLNSVVTTIINSGERPDPIWDILNSNGEPVQIKQYEQTWHDQALRMNYANLTADVTSAGQTTLSLDALGLTLFGFGSSAASDEEVTQLMVILPNGTFEKMIVASGIGTQTVTVFRGQFGTTALASIPAGTRVFAKTIAPQNGIITKSVFQAPTEFKNFFEIFRAVPEVSRSVEQYDYPGEAHTLAGQTDYVLKVLMRQYASAVYNGVRRSDTVNGKPRYEMGGMFDFGTKVTSAQTIDKQFIENSIISVLQENGANTNSLCFFVHRSQYPKITQLKRDLVINGGMSQVEKSVTADLETYDYMGVRLTFGVSDNLGPNRAVAFDRSRIQMARITEDTFSLQDPAKISDGERKLVVGELSAQFHNPAETIRYFTNIS